MASTTQRYRRLQVQNVWARAAFEIVAIIFAIVFCSVTIVTAYEHTYSEAMRDSTLASAAQLAHSISGLCDREAIAVEDEERAAYIAKEYSDDLESCFIGEDVLYTGAVYTLRSGEPTVYASTSHFLNVLEDNGLLASNSDADEPSLDSQAAAALRAAFTGIEGSVTQGDACIVFVPVSDSADTLPYAVTAVSVAHQSSFDYDSAVRSRVIVIAVVVGLLIIGYYLVSTMLSEKSRVKERAVSE